MRKLALAIIFALTGCVGHATTTAASPFYVHVQPAITGEDNSLSVHDDSATSPTLDVVMRMSDMDMPPVRATLRRMSSGDYVQEHVQFSMSGKWTIETVVGGRHEADVTVR